MTVEPAPSEWRLPTPPARSPVRAALGIPDNTTIIMVGHQAEAWHAGIAAKFYVARAVADELKKQGEAAAVVWLTPDHVATQPFRVRIPTRAAGRLGQAELDLAPALPEGGAASAGGSVRGLSADFGAHEPATDGVRAGIEAHRAALEAAAGEGNAARQVVRAMELVLGEDGAADVKVFASELGAAGALDGLVEKMREDPETCARAYNAAAAARPEAGIAPMQIGERVELPVWKIGSGRPVRVFADELGSIPASELAPRALTMTLLARRDLCEVFIHGTGGGVYDKVMEDWAARWLGETALAPMVVATATRYLPLGDLAADDAEIERAVQLAHSARHDPALLGDDAAAAEKKRLVAAIASAKDAGEETGGLFREMHELLGKTREKHAAELERLDELAAEAASRRGTAGLARDRTWAVSLFDQSVRDELAAEMKLAAAGIRSRARQPQG